MFNEIDLRVLAERQGPERAFLSLYLSGPQAMASLEPRVANVRRLLAEDPVELEYFEENLQLARSYLETYRFEAPALCLFVCWATDYVEAFPLQEPADDLLWVDSSPYIRPLAELQDEYENHVVVAADNTEAHVYFVTSATADETIRVKGDVKNHVKVGGWSQKRYERRRDRELHEYAKEIAAVVADLDGRASFRRISLVGSKETMEAIRAALPGPMAEKIIGEECVDLHQDDAVWQKAFDLSQEDERAAEAALWEQVKGAYLRGGRAVVGAEEVLKAAAVGRVARMIVTRDAKLAGIRCRECENLNAGAPEACPVCGSDSVFSVDLVNELVELLARTSAEAEFTDPIPGLSEVGDVAALLRY